MTSTRTKTVRPPSTRRPVALAVTLAAMAVSPMAVAQDYKLEEVLVTAQKRTESLQDVPISVLSLGEQQINQLGITNFDEYVAMLPNVSFSGVGPGTNQIFMRGASDGGDGNASGSQPTVGVYLDEQPVTAIGSNLDVYIYDIARIEALAGPQGTLYGASSQSGTLRIITNKPDPSAFAAAVDVDYSDTSDGSDSYALEGFVNMPIGDKAAIRLVGWDTQQGGWIDNVPGTRTYELEGGYGSDPDPTPGGRQVTINNNKLVDEDQNTADNTGARAALRIDLSEKWVGTASILTQQLDTEGAFDQDPTLGENEIQRYTRDFQNDDFTQYALTLEGEIANHSIIYAGSYMERDLDYYGDYTAYGEEAYWVPYYACDYYADEAGQCTNLATYLDFNNKYERTSQELRLQSLAEGRLHYTAGLYYEDSEHVYDQQWKMPGMSPSLWARGRENMFYNTDQKRTDEQWAVFGEVTYDITKSLYATVGARHYDSTNELAGYTGWGRTNFVEDYGFNVDSKTEDDDQIYKFNLTWNVTDDALVYGTWSEGYRVGGLNRDPNVPTPSYAPDKLTNYELGWKTTLLEGRMRFNGAAYYSEWVDMQYTIYTFDLSPVGNTYNVGEAEISGFETDLTYLVLENLTITAAAAYNDAQTSEDFVLANGVVSVPDGTDLPNVPEIKYALTSRYEFELAGLQSFAQVAYSYTDESWNDIRPSERVEQDDFANLNLRAGFDKDSWGMDFYVDNVMDDNDNITVGPRAYYLTATPQRPLTVGVKLRMRFD